MTDQASKQVQQNQAQTDQQLSKEEQRKKQQIEQQNQLNINQFPGAAQPLPGQAQGPRYLSPRQDFRNPASPCPYNTLRCKK